MAALIEAAKGRQFPAEIALAVSDRPVAYGLSIARGHGVATAIIDRAQFGRAAFDAELQAVLAKANIEFVCLAGFMRLLTPQFVEHWRRRILNIHPSLLPAFKGLNAPSQALAAGVAISGCTVHHVIADMDAGPIVGQAAVPVLAHDTVDRLAERIRKSEHVLYPAALKAVLTGVAPQLDSGMVMSIAAANT
jgi:phosphoribosylglycinamide formyltransferase-1